MDKKLENNSHPNCQQKMYIIELVFPDHYTNACIEHSLLMVDDTHIYIGEWLKSNFIRCYENIKAQYKRQQEEEGIIKPKQKKPKDIQIQSGQEKEKEKQSTQQYNIFFSIYSEVDNMYILLGRCDSNISNLKFSLKELRSDKLKIKCRKVQAQNIVHDFDTIKTITQPNCHRTKERKIKTIILKVNEWRQLYREGKTLEEAATIVGISKKSLDDYLLQIRCGNDHSYNFESYKEEKVGHLRKYVKKEKENEKKHRKTQKLKVFEIIDVRKDSFEIPSKKKKLEEK